MSPQHVAAGEGLGVDGAVRLAVVEKVATLIGLEPSISSAVGVLRDDGGWKVTVEMVEEKSVPEATDALACYEVRVGEDGELLEFTRVRLRKRADTDQG